MGDNNLELFCIKGEDYNSVRGKFKPLYFNDDGLPSGTVLVDKQLSPYSNNLDSLVLNINGSTVFIKEKNDTYTVRIGSRDFQSRLRAKQVLTQITGYNFNGENNDRHSS